MVVRFVAGLRRQREPRVSNQANIMTNSEIVETGKSGRVSKYSPIVADRLLGSLAAGLKQKQALHGNRYLQKHALDMAQTISRA